MQTVLPLRKIRDFGETLSDTIQFLKFNWKKLITLYAIFVVPFLLVAALLGASSFATLFGSISGLNTNGFSSITSALSPQLFIAVLLMFLSACAFGTVIFLYMKQYELNGGRQPEISEIGKQFLPKLLSNFMYSLISILFFFALALLAIIPIIGWIACIVGCFYLVITFSLLYPINTIEDPGFGIPISRSFSLIKNKWWYTFGYLIILTMIYYFFSMIIGLVVNLIFGFSSVNFLESDGSVFTKRYFLVTGISAVIQQIFYILIYTGIGIHYYSLREEKEGTGLDERLDQLGEGGIHGQIEEQY